MNVGMSGSVCPRCGINTAIHDDTMCAQLEAEASMPSVTERDTDHTEHYERLPRILLVS